MKKAQRINALIDIIKAHSGLTIKELAQMFNVSEMTIRRDMEIFKFNDIIKNVNGIAIYNSDANTIKFSDNYQIDVEATRQEKEKKCIGEFAATLISPDDIVIIGTGTTTSCLAQAIPLDMNITVLCYNMNILTKLYRKQNIRLIFAGGYYHPDTQMFESPEGIELIRNTRATKLFVSAAGVHDTLGVTVAQNYQTLTKRTAFRSALNKILLVDSSKFGKVCSAFYALLNEFDVIITDSRLSEDWQVRIEDLGVNLDMV